MGITTALDTLGNEVSEHPVATAAIGVGAAGLVTAGVLGIAAVSKSSKNKSRSKKSKRRIKHTKRGLRQDRRRFNKSQKWEVAYRRRKAKMARKTRKSRKLHHSKRVRYTKRGQPYVITKSGKAKFIKRRR